jgi:hypothetical protein
MKHWTYLFFLIIISCNSHQQNGRKSDNSASLSVTTLSETKKNGQNEICWTGTLSGKTPVFVHYQLDSNLIIGQITYLNTKYKLPITLLGTIKNKNTYRLLEFDNTGNITGIIEGKPTEKDFNGNWVSPKSKKELTITLTRKDTLIVSPGVQPDKSQIFGNYHYQYGENGFNGDFDITKVGDSKIAFNIHSLTNVERGPNIAEVEKDTIIMTGNSFIYKIPDSDSCEFKVEFYKGFININYTKGYCSGQFGLNATIDGIFIKTK